MSALPPLLQSAPRPGDAPHRSLRLAVFKLRSDPGGCAGIDGCPSGQTPEPHTTGCLLIRRSAPRLVGGTPQRTLRLAVVKPRPAPGGRAGIDDALFVSGIFELGDVKSTWEEFEVGACQAASLGKGLCPRISHPPLRLLPTILGDSEEFYASSMADSAACRNRGCGPS
jgi:hypothetical protein